MKTLYIPEPSALGDSLMILSMIYGLDEPVEMVVGSNSFWSKLKKIFNLDDRVVIREENDREKFQFFLENPPHPKHMTSIKIFSRYIEPNKLNLWNSVFNIKSRNKKCVAICINDGLLIKDQQFFDNCTISNNNDGRPFSKFIDKETYNHINFLTLAAGYDTIIIDHRDISLEHKIFVLNELCDFVITYEGGMAHLAHCLQIPVIVFPRRSVDNNYDDIKNESWHHLDKKTYFLHNLKEIMSWTPSKLVEIVNELHDNKGNNFWLENKNYTDIFPLTEYLKSTNTDNDRFFQQLKWLQDNMQHPTVGGF